MKTLTKLAFLSLSATMIAGIATAQPYHAYEVLTDLTPEQTIQLKQLGRISSNNDVNPIYDVKVERILTPAQNSEYQAKKFGKIIPSHASDIINGYSK